MRRAADRLTPVSLELGGKDPLIVLKDAYLERAANACVGVASSIAARCALPLSAFMSRAITIVFVDKVVEKVRALRQGASADELVAADLKESSTRFPPSCRRARSAPKHSPRRRIQISRLYYEPTGSRCESQHERCAR